MNCWRPVFLCGSFPRDMVWNTRAVAQFSCPGPSSSSSVSLLHFAIWIDVAEVCFCCQCLSYSVDNSWICDLPSLVLENSQWLFLQILLLFLIWDFRVWVFYTFGLVPVFVEDLACFLFVIVLRSIPSACLAPSVSVTGKFPSDLPWHPMAHSVAVPSVPASLLGGFFVSASLCSHVTKLFFLVVSFLLKSPSKQYIDYLYP